MSLGMTSNTFIIFLCCSAIASLHALNPCPGASDRSQENFPWKYNASPIIAYGVVSEVRDTAATFNVRCTIKGQLTDPVIKFIQPAQVSNTSQCHYLAASKTYLVFIESLTTTPPASQIVYRLADMQEIEINRQTVKKFLDDQCHEEEDYGGTMTVFYADLNNKCDQFTTICNERTKMSIANLDHSPLTQTSTFLGGMRSVSTVPNLNYTESGMNWSTPKTGMNDEDSRNAATMSTASMSISLTIAVLAMGWNH